MERPFMYRKKELNSYQWNSQSSTLHKNLVGSYCLYTIAMQPLLRVLLRDCWFKYWYVFWMIKHQSPVSKLLLCYIFLFIEQHFFQVPNCVVIDVQAAKFQLPNCCPGSVRCLKWQVQVSKVLLERVSGCKRKPNLVLYDASMLEHLHWCLVCDLAKIFLTSKLSFFFPQP